MIWIYLNSTSLGKLASLTSFMSTIHFLNFNHARWLYIFFFFIYARSLHLSFHSLLWHGITSNGLVSNINLTVSLSVFNYVTSHFEIYTEGLNECFDENLSTIYTYKRPQFLNLFGSKNQISSHLYYYMDTHLTNLICTILQMEDKV